MKLRKDQSDGDCCTSTYFSSYKSALNKNLLHNLDRIRDDSCLISEISDLGCFETVPYKHNFLHHFWSDKIFSLLECIKYKHLYINRCINLHTSIFSIHKLYMHICEAYVCIHVPANMIRKMEDYCLWIH